MAFPSKALWTKVGKSGETFVKQEEERKEGFFNYYFGKDQQPDEKGELLLTAGVSKQKRLG